jgi:ABC-2 type transport system ATP-binding protein
MEALKIDNLTKSFDKFKLNNITISLPKGYILGYIGQNGAGKTTTINLIMNFLKKDSGVIRVFGKEIDGNEVEYKEIIGYVSDDCYYPESITVKEVNAILKDFYPSFDENKFQTYMHNWELPNDKLIKEFSKGMKMKLMLAGVLSRETKLLILDEPTSGLDPVFRDELLTLLQEYILDGERSVLFSTHIMSDVEKVSDYICFIHKGNIVINDTKDNILENHVVVKGGLNDLDKFKAYMIAYKSTNMGFEGLAYRKDEHKFHGDLLVEMASIDDIVIYYTIKCNKK